ncbi:MAG: HAMP domain-containing histidine kinase [Holosporaceae bacterium]|jgi:PAS domain S-box-containing protein|nr:HAMP domain-containing histidine kinase [Holosporaceae bacterium]
MLNRVVATFRSTAIVWITLLVPLLIGVQLLKIALERDAEECVDALLSTESVGVAKYMAIQFDDTLKELDIVMTQVQLADLATKKSTVEKLKAIVKNNRDIAAVSIYDRNGRIIASSTVEDKVEHMTIQEMESLKSKVPYTLKQLKDESIVVKYMMTKSFKTEQTKSSEFFFEFLVKWDRYEKYMLKLRKGSFPRMFYIVSPDYNRYVSLNALPPGMTSDQTVRALGIHLTQSVDEIPEGLSEKSIESIKFRLFKNEIVRPQKMDGSKFYIVEATDVAAIETVGNRILRAIPKIKTLLTILWLLVCMVIARFYAKMKEQVKVTNTITDTTPMAVIVFRATDGKIIKINLVATILLRIKEEDIAAVNMWDLFIEKDDRDYIANAISSSINVSNYEVLVQTFGGGNFWSLCSASPILMDNEKYIALAILDINLRKEIEKKLADNAALLEKQIIERTADLETKAKELEESNTLLEKSRLIADEANKAKSKFLTNVSNELKTPLCAIIGYSEILEEEALDRKDTVSADDLNKITSSAKHLLALIDEILDLSQIESGKTQLFFQNFEVVNLIKEVEGVAMPLIANKDNSLFLECPKDIGVMYSDATKIRQCLLNLLSNAAKFTEFGKITLRIAQLAKSEGDFVEFSVVDTGVGIEESRIDTIFESFQEDASKSSSAGLGLSLTKKYVEYLSGTISVESTLGCGATFTIRLPRICKTEASEFIEIKNKKDEEVFDESENFSTETL